MNRWIFFVFLSITAFALSFLLFRLRKGHPNPLKSVWFWTSGVMTSVIFFAALILILLGLDSGSKQKKFSPEQWKKNPNERVKMIDNLIAAKSLNQLSKKAVIQLLGKPDGGDYSIEGTFTYYLGPERGFMSIDSEWLSIWFKNGKVERYKIWRD